MSADTTARPKMGGLGLDDIGDLSELLSQPTATGGGFKPMELELSLIDEDPEQPRTEDNPGFSAESLRELAATIRPRGVKTPISVRDNPAEPGRYIINHGARRVRASKLADRTTIPAYVDNDYLAADQVIENLQRDALTSREIADYIGRELAKGLKKREIAASLGKSPAFVSQHVTLLDLPEPIAKAFSSGRISDVTLINELVKVFKKYPDDALAWLADESQELTRGTVGLLREYLEEKEQAGKPDTRAPAAEQPLDGLTGASSSSADRWGGGDSSTERATDGGPAAGAGGAAQDIPPFVDDPNGGESDVDERPRADEKSAPTKSAAGASDPETLKRAIVLVEYHGRRARLVLARRPSAEGLAWLKYEDDGEEIEADLSLVRLAAVIEG